MSNIIKPGTPKVDKEVQTVKASDNEKAEKGNYWLRRVGQDLEPPGFEYVGSLAVHVYRNRFQDHSYTAVSQPLVDPLKCPEGLADFGFKELKAAAMARYGRKEPKKR